MYNYKIDDVDTAKVIDAYKQYINDEVVYDTINKIKNNISSLNLTDQVENVKDYNKSGFIGKNLVISNPNAFSEEEIERFTTIDKEFSDVLDAITFELNSLNQLRKKAISDFNIADAVKYTDKIMKLNVNVADEQAKISKFNNQIKDTELEFDVKFNELKSKMDDKSISSIKSEVFEQYDKNVVRAYVFDKISSAVSSAIKGLNEDDVNKTLSSAVFLDYLGEGFKDIKNVGANI